MLHCSAEQKEELQSRAAAEGLSLPNFIRSRLDLPLEQQGQRKDLVAPTPPANNALQPTPRKRASHQRGKGRG